MKKNTVRKWIKDIYKHFNKEDTQMTNNQMAR